MVEYLYFVYIQMDIKLVSELTYCYSANVLTSHDRLSSTGGDSILISARII